MNVVNLTHAVIHIVSIQVSVFHKDSSVSDGMATLISDSILVGLVQMRGEDYAAIARGITTRVTAITGGEKWNCFIGERDKFSWDNRPVSHIICQTDDLVIHLFRQT